MSRYILIIILCIYCLTINLTIAQTCHELHTGYKSVPDTGAVYPASLPDAMAGVPYDEVITIGVPSKATIPGTGTVSINWIQFKSLKNAPSGMTIYDSLGNTNYPKMNKLTWNCFSIVWPNPIAGTYTVQIVVDVNVKLGIINYTYSNYAANSFNIVVKQYYNIDGIVSYDNSIGSPLKNVTLALKNKSDVIISTTTTDSTGYYKFANLDTGKYSISAAYNKSVGDINPVDALLANRNYLKLYNFPDNLKAKAADVNADTKVNPVDALLINRFYLKLVSSFNAGKWVFESPAITINSGNVTQNMKGLCVGDVNGSFKP